MDFDYSATVHIDYSGTVHISATQADFALFPHFSSLFLPDCFNSIPYIIKHFACKFHSDKLTDNTIKLKYDRFRVVNMSILDSSNTSTLEL